MSHRQTSSLKGSLREPIRQGGGTFLHALITRGCQGSDHTPDPTVTTQNASIEFSRWQNLKAGLVSALAALSQESNKGWSHRQWPGSSHGPPQRQKRDAIAKIQGAAAPALF